MVIIDRPQSAVYVSMVRTPLSISTQTLVVPVSCDYLGMSIMLIARGMVQLIVEMTFSSGISNFIFAPIKHFQYLFFDFS